MKLNKGIPIIPNIDFDDQSVQINSGVIPYSDMSFESLDFPFKEGAFIPRNDWQKLSNEQIESIFSDQYSNNDFIYIGKMSSEIVEVIQRFNFHSLTDRKLVFKKMRENFENLEKFNKLLNSFSHQLSNNIEQLEFHRLSVIPSGRYTTSINISLEDYEYIGMHIDHSTIFNIETAHKSRNRICINIGNENRYLYIINLTLIQIRELLKDHMNINDLNVENICEYFFKYFPDYPVLKIKQKPYEYYVAPTDNFIHDGSTFQNKYLDITVTYLGDFKHLKK